MATFAKAFHFERFVPCLGNNRDLSPTEQLAIEIATGMSKTDMAAFAKGWAAAFEPPADPPADETPETAVARSAAHLDHQSETLATHWGAFVKLERGGHSIEGVEVNNLRAYLRVFIDQPGGYSLLELSREVYRHNSVDGTRALFSAARSGGSVGTDDQSAQRKAAH